MHELSAGLLSALEQWMLTASPGSVDMASYLDTAPDFQPVASALEAVQSRLYKDDVRAQGPGLRVQGPGLRARMHGQRLVACCGLPGRAVRSLKVLGS